MKMLNCLVLAVGLISAIHWSYGAPANIFGNNPKDLFEGDLRLSKQQEKVVKQAISTGQTVQDVEISTFGASSTAFKRWTNGRVYYTIDSRLNHHGYLTPIKRAMAEWEAKTCIRFYPRTTQINYLEFFQGTGCWGHVGMGGGKTQISVGQGCAYQHVMTHEIGHALGFWHEQSRTDRDSYIQILWQNVPKSLYEAFAKYGSDKIDSLGVPYDYGSIMHYPWNAFSVNGQNTVRPLRTVRNQPYRVLSDLDAKQANIMYKCSGTAKTTPTTPKVMTTCVPVIVPQTTNCRDNHRLCPQWASRNECYRNPNFMRVNCKKSCRICSQVCSDRSGFCPSWARQGECTRNPQYMRTNCQKSCGICSTVKVTKKCRTVTHPTTKPRVTTPVTKPKPIVTKAKTTTTQTPPLPPIGKVTTQTPPIPPVDPVTTKKVTKETQTPPLVIPTTKTPGKATTTIPPPPPLVTLPPKPKTTTALPPPPPPVPGCVAPVAAGLETFMIPNSQLNASSSYNKYHGPQEARLNYSPGLTGVGAWCPARNDVNQYIEVDLGKVAELAQVATQGRLGKYEKYVKTYSLSTSIDGKTFTPVKASPTDTKPEEFIGNTDQSTAVTNSLSQMITARYVRLHPISWKSAICLRMELYVCWTKTGAPVV